MGRPLKTRFEINSPLLSRCRVVRLEPLGQESLIALAKNAVSDVEKGLGSKGVSVDDESLRALARIADGDARRMLNLLEAAVEHASRQGLKVVDQGVLETVQTGPSLRYDRAYEEHYNVVSAFIKSMRGSDPDAAMYWMVRMLEAGEDPGFICRRMIIFAAEDVGNADPRALQVAVAAKDAFEYLGLPEAAIPMAQAVTYLAGAPKSNASYKALTSAQKAVRQYGLEVPMHLRNARTQRWPSLVTQGTSIHTTTRALYNRRVPKGTTGLGLVSPIEAGYEKTITRGLLIGATLESKQRRVMMEQLDKMPADLSKIDASVVVFDDHFAINSRPDASIGVYCFEGAMVIEKSTNDVIEL